MTATRRKTARSENDRLMDTDQLSEYLQVPAKTIKWWRRRHEGPPFIKVNGRLVRYRLSAVDEWLDGQTVGAA